MKTFRILFTLVCAACIAVLPFFLIFWMNLIAIPLLLAGASFFLMIYFKNKHELQENPPQPTGDYFHPLKKESEAQSEAASTASKTSNDKTEAADNTTTQTATDTTKLEEAE